MGILLRVRPLGIEMTRLLRVVRRPLKGDIFKGAHLKMGSRTELRTRYVDFALKFALDTSIALSKPFRRHSALKNAILRCLGSRCRGLGLPHARAQATNDHLPSPLQRLCWSLSPMHLCKDLLCDTVLKGYCAILGNQGGMSNWAGKLQGRASSGDFSNPLKPLAKHPCSWHCCSHHRFTKRTSVLHFVP